MRRGLRGAGGVLVVNTVAPVLGGATYAGGSPAVTAGTWSGNPTLTYSLEVNGVEVASGTEQQIEAYVYVLGDEGYNAILYEIPNGDTAAQVASNTVAIDLAAAIAAKFTAESWTALGIFLVRRTAIDLSLVATAVETWINHGTGSDATEASGTERPTYSATALNSLPGLTFDGGDHLETSAIDGSTYTAAALMCLFSDSDTAQRYQAGWGDFGATGATAKITLTTNAGSAATLECVGRHTAAFSQARSAASFAMSTPAVVTGTYDTALATNETTIRHAGVDVTNTRPSNSNTSGNFCNELVRIGGKVGASPAPFTGAMSACVLAAGTSAVPTSTLAEVEAMLAAAWGL